MTPAEIAQAKRDYYGCCHSWRCLGHSPWCRYHPDNRPEVQKERLAVRAILKEQDNA